MLKEKVTNLSSTILPCKPLYESIFNIIPIFEVRNYFVFAPRPNREVLKLPLILKQIAYRQIKWAFHMTQPKVNPEVQLVTRIKYSIIVTKDKK